MRTATLRLPLPLPYFTLILWKYRVLFGVAIERESPGRPAVSSRSDQSPSAAAAAAAHLSELNDKQHDVEKDDEPRALSLVQQLSDDGGYRRLKPVNSSRSAAAKELPDDDSLAGGHLLVTEPRGRALVVSRGGVIEPRGRARLAAAGVVHRRRGTRIAYPGAPVPASSGLRGGWSVADLPYVMGMPQQHQQLPLPGRPRIGGQHGREVRTFFRTFLFLSIFTVSTTGNVLNTGVLV